MTETNSDRAFMRFMTDEEKEQMRKELGPVGRDDAPRLVVGPHVPYTIWNNKVILYPEFDNG